MHIPQTLLLNAGLVLLFTAYRPYFYPLFPPAHLPSSLHSFLLLSLPTPNSPWVATPPPNRHVLAVGNEAGDFLLMTLRVPPNAKATTTSMTNGDRRTETHHHHQQQHHHVGFSWDVLARKRIPFGGAIPAPTPAASAPAQAAPRSTRFEHSGPNSKEDSTDFGGSDGSAGSAMRAGWRGGSSFNSTVPIDRGRRLRVTEQWEGAGAWAGARRNDDRHHHPVRRRRGGDSVSPEKYEDVSPARSTPRRGGAAVGLGAATGAGAAAEAGAGTAMEVSVLRFSPSGTILAAACGGSIHLYNEGGNATAAVTAKSVSSSNGDATARHDGASGTNTSIGQGTYRRYGVCTGHSTTVKSMDFSDDGSVLQSYDSSGELLFWDVSAGKQVDGAGRGGGRRGEVTRRAG